MHTLPPLPYSYDALEPVIDSMTMQIHHTKHHQTYIDKFNAWLSTHPNYEWLSVVELLEKTKELPEAIQNIVRNHGGWHANHTLFWKIMKSSTDNNRPTDWLSINQAIISTFWSFEAFQSNFSDKAIAHFWSWWCRLIQAETELKIITTSNQDSPIMDGNIPLLWLDLWEHAYYLHYQNKRADYVSARWSLVNWQEVEKNFNK